MCLFICDPNKPCNTYTPQIFILAPDQSPHPNQWHQFQPHREIKGIFHLGANFPGGECISILPCAYCLGLDPSMLNYWWRVPAAPEVQGAACRSGRLIKCKPLFEWEIVGRSEVEGYIKKGVDKKGLHQYDPFAGLPDAKWPMFVTPRTGKEKKAVAWADMDVVDMSMDMDVEISIS